MNWRAAGGNERTALWKTVWGVLTKLNTLSLYDPAAAPLAVCPEELETCVYTKPHTHMFTAGLPAGEQAFQVRMYFMYFLMIKSVAIILQKYGSIVAI